jgi:hypothetical protein
VGRIRILALFFAEFPDYNGCMGKFSRRDFLKLSGLALAGVGLAPAYSTLTLPEFPEAEKLGRVAVGKVDLKLRPQADSQTTGVLYEDAVIPWLREVVGKNLARTNQRWVETTEGYVWGGNIQPVQNRPNPAVQSLQETSLGTGMWVEVTQPYVDLVLDNPPARSPGFQDLLKLGMSLRLYYSQVVWVDRLKVDDSSQTWYRVNEKYGTYGDILWGRAEGFRPIAQDEIAPISPDVDEKRVLVDLRHQTMSCYEGKHEVYFARISSGAKWDAYGNKVDVWATPVGQFPIWRKLISLHMSGGTTGGGWDLPGVGWTSLFVGSGVAIHSTFWHNNYGEPVSRGCVNARPEDAKWVFRWTLPEVSYDPGDATVSWPGGTKVVVIE